MHIGNSNIRNLFIAISDNRVILVKSALVDFIKEMKEIEPIIRHRNFFSKHFENNNMYYYQNPETGKQYIFQKIENTKD